MQPTTQKRLERVEADLYQNGLAKAISRLESSVALLNKILAACGAALVAATVLQVFN